MIKPLILLFAPFVLNLALSMATAFTVPWELWARDPSRASLVFFSRMYTWQSPAMMVIQVVFGLAAYSQLKSREELYSFEDLKPLWRTLLIVAGLTAFSFVLFTAEGAFYVYMYYGGNWTEYSSSWAAMVKEVPLWARLLNALAAPFTAGVFEEVLWRGYGITVLEKRFSTRKAVFIQAVAFGLWHVSPIHVVVTAIIGFMYGFLFVKRRRLLILMVTHIVTDLLGFSGFLFSP